MVLSVFEEPRRQLMPRAIAGTLFGFAFWVVSMIVPFEGNWKILRAFALVMGVGCSGYGVAKVLEVDRDHPNYLAREQARRDIEQYSYARETLPYLATGASKATVPTPEKAGDRLDVYTWERLQSEATGIEIVGNSGSGKTSVCAFVLGVLTQNQPAIIEVMDIHAGMNKIWQELGLKTVSKPNEISKRLQFALDELDRRIELAEQGHTKFQPYIFVCDELDGCRKRFENPEIIDDVMSILGKEGRKYGLTLVFITHTPNVGNKGLDAKEKMSYITIALGGIARALAGQSFKRNTTEFQFVNVQAYPCIVSSSGVTLPALHPTHYKYEEYRQEGNPPLNLLPINQLSTAPPPHITPTSHIWGYPALDVGVRTASEMAPTGGINRSHSTSAKTVVKNGSVLNVNHTNFFCIYTH